MSGSSPRGVDLNKGTFFFSKCVQWKPASNTDLLQCFLKLSPGESGLDSREQIPLLVLLNNLFFHFELAFFIMNTLSIHQPLQTTERAALQLAQKSGLLANNHNFTAIKLAQQGWTSCRYQYSKGSPGRLILPVTSMSNESDMPWPIVLTPIQEKVPSSTSSREERVRLDVVSSNSFSSLKRKLLSHISVGGSYLVQTKCDALGRPGSTKLQNRVTLLPFLVSPSSWRSDIPGKSVSKDSNKSLCYFAFFLN